VGAGLLQPGEQRTMSRLGARAVLLVEELLIGPNAADERLRRLDARIDRQGHARSAPIPRLRARRQSSVELRLVQNTPSDEVFQALKGALDKHQTRVLGFERVVVIEFACIDQRHTARAVLGQQLLGASANASRKMRTAQRARRLDGRRADAWKA
jgi:hypothetical protein